MKKVNKIEKMLSLKDDLIRAIYLGDEVLIREITLALNGITGNPIMMTEDHMVDPAFDDLMSNRYRNMSEFKRYLNEE